MLSIAHSATGAFIATAIPNPIISTPLILASHYIEDWIIHWDVGTGLSSGRKKPADAFKHELIDMALTGAFVFVFFQFSHQSINFNAWYGAFVALVPDFLEAPRNFFKWEPAWLKPINKFHGHFHHSTPDMVKGLIPQIALLLVIAWLA